eukprot:gene28514-35384_t
MDIVNNNNFGVSVAIDGLAVAIGANSWATYIGKVFIYRFMENKYWLPEATLTSPMGIGEGFGHSVALSGDFALITTGTNHAFIYELVDSQWTLNSQLLPPSENVHFGHTAAIEGDTIVVGAESVGGSEGAVFIYKLNYTDPAHHWYLTDTLSSVDGYSTYFGHAVDISENTIVVGAKGYEPVVFQARANETANNTGWAYIYDFNQTSSQWSLSQRLVSPVGDKSNFGASVAVHKGALIVGADGFPAGARTGASFIYKRNETNTDSAANWKFDTALPSAAGYAARFGAAVDISDTYTATGAYAYDDLRGGIFLACRPDANQPSHSPVFAPSQPTSSPTKGTDKFSAGEFNNHIKSKWSWGMLLAILLAAVVGAVTTGTMIYYCCGCCVVPPAIIKKKKKKDEEEDSTYTVHGPGGLMSEEGSVYSESYYSSDDGTDYSYESSVVSSNPEVAKKTKKDKKDKKGSDSAGSKFKVHSYRGYNDKDDKKKEKLGEKEGIAARDKTSVGKVHSYAGYVDEESGLDDAETGKPSSSSSSTLPKRGLSKSLSHEDKNLMTTVIRSIASSLAGTPTASSTDPDDEEDEDDSLYRTQMERVPSDSFFENDGTDDVAEEEVALQSSNLRTKKAKKLTRLQIQENDDTQSVGTADSHSLVDQARAHVAAAREVTLRRSQPLRCISPAMLSDSEEDDEATPRVATFRDESPTSARRDSDTGSVGSASLVEQARAKVAAIRAKQTGDLSANSSFTFSNSEGIASPTASFSRAKTSYADYKAKLEQEDSMRTEEAARIRETLERARLQSEAEISERQKRIEREAFEAAVLEEAAARTKADQAAKQRIANFKVRQDEMARQRAEEEARQNAHLKLALVEAED